MHQGNTQPTLRTPYSELRTGFTLIELLVVIAIISLLVSILLPSLTKARELAKAVVCMNNEKSIGLAVQFYAEGNDDLLIPAALPVGGDPNNGHYEAHTVLFESGYLNNLEAWTCPSASYDPTWYGSKEYDEDTGEPTKGRGCRGLGYAVNFRHVHDQGVWNLDALPISNLTRPAEVLSFLDSLTHDNRRIPGVWELPYYIHCPWCAGGNVTEISLTDRHNGNSNVLFADGHVDPVDYYDLLNNEKDIWGHDRY